MQAEFYAVAFRKKNCTIGWSSLLQIWMMDAVLRGREGITSGDPLAGRFKPICTGFTENQSICMYMIISGLIILDRNVIY